MMSKIFKVVEMKNRMEVVKVSMEGEKEIFVQQYRISVFQDEKILEIFYTARLVVNTILLHTET